MRFSLTSLIRLIALGALTSTTAAVGLSRMFPVPGHVLIEAPPRYVCVNGLSFEPVLQGSYLLDTEAGVLSPLSPVDGVTIEYATCSPWSDGRNSYEVVGRAVVRDGIASSSLCQGLGLVRASLPHPSIREPISMSPVITGRPCWIPGKVSRIAFPAGDGLLYTEDLPDAHGANGTSAPRPIDWSCPAPGSTNVLLGDPVAPIVPSLGGRIFVTLMIGDDRARRIKDRSEIWWLKLDPEEQSIVAAGRVATRDVREEQRLPNICVAPDGRLAFAFLSRFPGEPEWHLRVTTLNVDPKTGVPTADTEAARDLGQRFCVTPPAFSPDGRWLFAIPRSQPTAQRVQRFSILEALDPASPEGGDRPFR